MNKRQKKKFEKKDRYKKYGIVTRLIFVEGKNESIDALVYRYHNGNRKIKSAYRLIDCYPANLDNYNKSNMVSIYNDGELQGQYEFQMNFFCSSPSAHIEQQMLDTYKRNLLSIQENIINKEDMNNE